MLLLPLLLPTMAAVMMVMMMITSRPQDGLRGCSRR